MRYGVPYKGSKNGIAQWVYSHFPKTENFYDLFAGGCAILQVALMQQEYKNYIASDIDADGIKLFLDAIQGKFQNEKRWISRKEFFELKDKEPYIKYCWSFGNNGRDYLYSKEIEPYKKAWHFAIFENDFSYAEKLKIDLEPIKEIKEIKEKYLYSKKVIEAITEKQQKSGLVRQQQLEALNRLQSLQSDYAAIEIKDNSVIFCDIPYNDTNCYGEKNIKTFDYERFYSWAESQKEFCLICEYSMPEDRFVCIDEIEKPVMLNSGADLKAIEKIFIPKHQEEKYRNWQLEKGGYLFPTF